VTWLSPIIGKEMVNKAESSWGGPSFVQRMGPADYGKKKKKIGTLNDYCEKIEEMHAIFAK
jgi:hypothetical protein